MNTFEDHFTAHEVIHLRKHAVGSAIISSHITCISCHIIVTSCTTTCLPSLRTLRHDSYRQIIRRFRTFGSAALRIVLHHSFLRIFSILDSLLTYVSLIPFRLMNSIPKHVMIFPHTQIMVLYLISFEG